MTKPKPPRFQPRQPRQLHEDVPAAPPQPDAHATARATWAQSHHARLLAAESAAAAAALVADTPAVNDTLRLVLATLTHPEAGRGRAATRLIQASGLTHDDVMHAGLLLLAMRGSVEAWHAHTHRPRWPAQPGAAAPVGQRPARERPGRASKQRARQPTEQAQEQEQGTPPCP